MDIEEIKKHADFGSVEKRPTWGTVTSVELAEILGVTHQCLSNWKLRGRLPEPEPRRKGGGNKNRWVISTIKKWLYDTPEDETHWQWIHDNMSDEFESLEHAMWNAEKYWRVFGIEKYG